jgi:hypothetical protein
VLFYFVLFCFVLCCFVLAFFSIGEDSLFVYGSNNQNEVKEFSSTPFVSESKKYSNLMSFVRESIEYKLGDFLQTKDDKVYRIDSLFYQQKSVEEMKVAKNLFPELRINAHEFRPVSWFNSNYPSFELKEHERELIEMPSLVSVLSPSEIKYKVSVLQHNQWANCALPQMAFFCRHKYLDNALSSWVPIKESFSWPAIEQKGLFLWIEICLDSFGTYSTRSKSTTGVYIGFSNMRSVGRLHQYAISALIAFFFLFLLFFF